MKKNKRQEQEQDRVAEPVPVNRMVTRDQVRVRALRHVDEGGHRSPGDVFEVDAARRAALGGLVEDVTG